MSRTARVNLRLSDDDTVAQSIHQYGRFADNKKSFEYFTRSMGDGETAIFEDGWAPYCIPCIVKFIAGDKIE